jgi:hypothetical protein
VEQPATPVLQAGFDLDSYSAYIATSVTENQAPKVVAIKPPKSDTRNTCPSFLETSIVVWSISTEKGILGIQLVKQIT